MSEARNLATWAREYLRLHRGVRWLVIGLLALFMLSIARCALAQTAPVITLTVTPTSGISPVTPVATWSVTNAVSCTASGAWAGTKATSGTETLPVIQANASYALTCAGAAGQAVGSMTVSWTPPTKNTDGTTLTDLDGYDLMYGTRPDELINVIDIKDQGLTKYTVEPLPIPAAGVTYYVGLRAYNAKAIRSDTSNIKSKEFPPGGQVAPTATKTVNVLVNQKPGIPVLLVSSAVARAVKVSYSSGKATFTLDKEIGTVPVGTVCRRDFRISGTNFYRVDRRYVSFTVDTDTTLIVANCSNNLVTG